MSELAASGDVPNRTDGHRRGIFWLTGLSGSGKSTLAFGAARVLCEAGARVHVLDGDRLRQGLNRDLGFSDADRMENMRRVAEVSVLFADAGMITIVSLISPLQSGRELARQLVGEGFHEIHVAADLDTCERRDPKGLYGRARLGAVTSFTGVSSVYEIPSAPQLVVDTQTQNSQQAVRQIVAYIRSETGLH